MASPARFPAGLATFPQRHILGSFPIATSPKQIALLEDFLPYRAGDYTVTQTNGTATQFSWPSGAVRLNTTGGSAADRIFLQRIGAAFQAVNGNQFWMNFRVAYSRTVGNANDTNIYLGWFDNADPVAAANGIYFLKPTGGTSVNFVIRKAGVSTTFQNIADLALPSGLFGDTNSVNAVLASVVAGNAFTNVTVNTAGAGYQLSPLVLSTTASGTAGLVPVFAGIGSTAYTSSQPNVPIQSTGWPYASIVAPSIINPTAAAFTNSAGNTTWLEVEPILDLSAWFDGNGTLLVGVNGRPTLAIRGTSSQLGNVAVAAGATVNVATTGPSYYSATQVGTGIMPFQPPIGSPMNLFPLLPMTFNAGFIGTTANARALHLFEVYNAVELN